MRRDWIWGWISAVPALIAAMMLAERIGFLHDRPWLTVGFMLALVAIISTGTVWIANRRSLKTIERVGGEIEFLLRPVDALKKALVLFPAIVGVTVLIRLVIDSESIEWGKDIVHGAAIAYALSLASTSYKRAE